MVVNHRVQETRATIDLFASWGVAVFPGPYGDKGTRTKGWPEFSPQAARTLALEELRNGPVNIAARTGTEFGVIDLDRHSDVNPNDALGRLLKLLPDGVAVARTGKGFHIYFHPSRSVGDGKLPDYGAELFTAGHLVNLPPSRHPDGVNYEWVIPPGGQLTTVDLEALGLVPQQTKAVPATDGHWRGGRLQPASPEAQEDFRALMAQLGVHPQRGGDEKLLCHSPLHQDSKTKSLHVNWEAAAFYCFAVGCDWRGGRRGARRLLGLDERPVRRQLGAGRLARFVASDSARDSHINVEVEQARLVAAAREAGLPGRGRRNDPYAEEWRDLWEEIEACHVALVPRRCDDGHVYAQAYSCDARVCPNCLPSQLKRDFRRHQGNLPERLALFILTPPAAAQSRSEVYKWFKKWRRGAVDAGFWGIRHRVGHPLDMLLVLPADEVSGSIASDPCVTIVAADVGIDEMVGWYTARFLEAACSWRTVDELMDLLATKGARRFQGFGRYYQLPSKATGEGDADHDAAGEAGVEKKLFKVSGGSAKSRRVKESCPYCGAPVRVGPIIRNPQGWTWDRAHGCFVLGTGPPVPEAACVG